MKILALAFSLLALTAAHAQPKEDPKLTALFDKADWPKEKLIDCKGASKDAVTQVPVEIAGFARIVCTKSGHHFTSKRGWHWHHQADGLPPFFVSAGSSLAVNGVVPETIGHKGYFTKIEVKRIDYWRNFSASYPFVLATRVPVLQAINEQITQKKPALQIALTTMKGEVMIVQVLDVNKPYDFAYVATVPATTAVILINDLTKVQAAKDKQPPAKAQ